MKQFTCENCGAHEYYLFDGFQVCQYCESKFLITEESMPKTETVIALEDDIQRLLEKCKQEPWKARRYANLILDIDPGNKEAIQYLRRSHV